MLSIVNWIFFIITIRVVTALYTNCEETPPVIHASINVQDDDNSVTVHYKCDTGFKLEGPSDIICDLDTDEWSPDPPICKPEEGNINEDGSLQIKQPPIGTTLSEDFVKQLDMSCVAAKIKAPSIKNGQIVKYDRKKMHGLLFLVAVYECNERFEFEIESNSKLYCSNQNWIGENPVCISNGIEYEEDYEEGEDEGDESDEHRNKEIQTNNIQDKYENIEPLHTNNIPESTSIIPNIQNTIINENLSEKIVIDHIENNEVYRTHDFNDSLSLGTIKSDNESVNETDHEKNKISQGNINSYNEDVKENYEGEKIYIELTIKQTCNVSNGGCDHICQMIFNTEENDETVECSCNPGFTIDSNKKRCNDIDECLSPNIASVCPNGCENIPGSYYCSESTSLTTEKFLEVDSNSWIMNSSVNGLNAVTQTECGSGFLKNEQNQCIDVDECSQGNTGCQYCENTVGAYECICPPGFDLMDDGKICEDINECQMYLEYGSQEISKSTHSICSHECINLVGSYKCVCPQNSHLDLDMRSCVLDYCKDLQNAELNKTKCSQICEDNADGFVCKCQDGFTLDKDLKACIMDKINNPCLESNGNRACHPGKCINQGTNYYCECPAGYTVGANENVCVDIDECENDSHECSHYCVNINGSFKCTCPEGLQLSSDNKKCVHIKSCYYNNGDCSHFCSQTDDDLICHCPENMLLLPDGLTCTVIDKCIQDNNGCSQKCNKDDGQCFCDNGFELLGDLRTCVDIDECLNSNAGCNQICQNLPGSYQCLCKKGFTLLNETGQCEDINECLLENGSCSHICINLPGSFQCSCPVGQVLIDDEKTCHYFDECQINNGGCSHNCSYFNGQITCFCPAGFRLDKTNSKNCVDINECLESFKCSHFCENSLGSFKCNCPIGYILNDDGYSCLDFDECLLNYGNCSNICINILGSFKCACETGFEIGSDLRTCEDIDECYQFNDCSHDCINRKGSYECSCPTGFQLRDGRNCEDIDECRFNNGNCSGNCYNNEGSFYCETVDYCLRTRCSHECKNKGSVGYECSCNNGWKLAVDQHTCIDIDECLENNGGCNYMCENTEGSFNCKCPVGYKLDTNGQCVDVDECMDNNGGCYNHAMCSNLPGSYECNCLDGLKLGHDKKGCVEIKDLCEPLKPPKNGEVHCTKSRHKTEIHYKTKCNVWCKNGYKLEGPNTRYCNDVGEWDKFDNNCSSYTCSAIPYPKNGIILPSHCTTDLIAIGERCVLHCSSGYTPIGKRAAICNADQTWSTNSTLDCVSISSSTPQAIRPFIKCPQDTILILPKNQKTVFIRLEQPKTNVDFERNVDSHPAWAKNLDAHLGPGEHVITFRARSPNSYLNAICRAVITVKEAEGVSISYCPPSYEIQLGIDETSRSLSWKEPIFQSHSQLKHIYKSRNSGERFEPGVHNIMYVATDNDGSKAKCEFKLIVKGPVPDVSSKLVLNQHQNEMSGYRGSGLPNHESYLICPGRPTEKIDTKYLIHVPVGCFIKNIHVSNIRHHRRRHQLRSYLNNSLRHYSSWNDPKLQRQVQTLYNTY